MSARLSIVMPTLNEAEGIAARLAALQGARAAGVEIVLSDGGSADATLERAAGLCDAIVHAPRGRAAQMNAGASVASGGVLLFLHADTRLPEGFAALALDGLKRSGRAWGRFDVRIEGRSRLLPLVGAMINLRSRLTGVATGDQAMFVRRDALKALGGFADLALMEDIALSRRLKRVSRPLCLRAKATTSGRRWDKHGALRTIVLMWRLRLAYYCGAHPDDLARRYGYQPRKRPEERT